MKKQNDNYITVKGLERLREEYQRLKYHERPPTVTAVSDAAALGDRSENADYLYNKKKLREIDRRLGYLSKRLETAIVVDPQTITSQTIVFGATVEVEDEEGVRRTYRIVGEDEIKAEEGAISWKSPVARALLGKKVGDESIIRRPAGDLLVEIIKVSYES